MKKYRSRKSAQRYITMHPRLKAGEDLQKIMYHLASTIQTIFTKKLNEWYKKYKEFKIHNTTNAIDGGVFSPMKKLLKIHNGFTRSLKFSLF